MNADEKRKVFEELLEEYQNFIESEFSYEDGEREAERKTWLNKYDGIKEPLIKDEKIRNFIRDWAEMNDIKLVYVCQTFNAWGVKNKANGNPEDEEYMLADILFRGERPEELEPGREYTIAELCGEEEE